MERISVLLQLRFRLDTLRYDFNEIFLTFVLESPPNLIKGKEP